MMPLADMPLVTVDVGIHEARIGGQRCFLIDTPGFDDTNRRDTDILRAIADWLNRYYQNKIHLAGIVYLHRIIDTRVGGTSLKNLRMFKKLCGPEGLSSVVLATTMWSMVTAAEGERRENELIAKKEFWGEMITQGSVVMRQDQGEASAIKIIQHILGQRRRMVLKVQQEVAKGKTLDETDAGRELEAELEAMKRQHENELRELREEMKEALVAADKRSQAEIAAIRADLQKRIEQENVDRERMRVTNIELQKQRDEELRAMRQEHYEQQLQHQKVLADANASRRLKELEAQHKVELLEVSY